MPEGVSSRRLFFYTSTTDVVNDASWLRDKLPITKGSLSRSHEPSVTALPLNARPFEAELRWWRRRSNAPPRAVLWIVTTHSRVCSLQQRAAGQFYGRAETRTLPVVLLLLFVGGGILATIFGLKPVHAVVAQYFPRAENEDVLVLSAGMGNTHAFDRRASFHKVT